MQLSKIFSDLCCNLTSVRLKNGPLLRGPCRWPLLHLGLSPAQGDNLRNSVRGTLSQRAGWWNLQEIHWDTLINLYCRWTLTCIYIMIMMKLWHVRWKLDFSGSPAFPQLSHVQQRSEKKCRHLWFFVRQCTNSSPCAINSLQSIPNWSTVIEIWLLSIAKTEQKHDASASNRRLYVLCSGGLSNKTWKDEASLKWRLYKENQKT